MRTGAAPRLPTALGGGARSAASVSLLLTGLTLGHAALALAATSTLGMAAVLLLAGATIAPTEASVYAIVDDVAPVGTLTESFSWLATAAAVGAALGAAAGGSLVASAGPVSAFALAAVAGLIAVLGAILRGGTLPSAAGGSGVRRRCGLSRPGSPHGSVAKTKALNEPASLCHR